MREGGSARVRKSPHSSGKGQVSVQLSWLFAVIAGVSVLVLLFSFLRSESDEASKVSNAKILEHLEAELRVLSRNPSPESFNTVKLPEREVLFFCNDPDTSGLSIKGSESVLNTRFTPLFAPKKLKGKELLVWGLDWALPTPVEKLLFVANPSTLFVIVRDSSNYWEAFNDSLPSMFEREVVNFATAKEYSRKGFDNYRFVFFSQSLSEIEQITSSTLGVKGRITGVKFFPDSSVGSELSKSGRVKFFSFKDKFKPGRDSFYAGKALLYAAAFSDSRNYYLCGLSKALFKLGLVSRVNEDRANALLSTGSLSASCSDYYSKLAEKYSALGRTTPTLNSLKNAYQLSTELESVRDEVIAEGCPPP